MNSRVSGARNRVLSILFALKAPVWSGLPISCLSIRGRWTFAANGRKLTQTFDGVNGAHVLDVVDALLVVVLDDEVVGAAVVVVLELELEELDCTRRIQREKSDALHKESSYRSGTGDGRARR